MYEAYPIVVWFVVTILFFIWRPDGFLNTAIKVLLLALSIWSVLDGMDRLHIVKAYGFNKNVDSVTETRTK
jgi:hypothetical protein